MNLDGRTALITGASSGIGERLAWHLAQRGATLMLVARREDRLEALRRELIAARPRVRVHVLGCDLAVPGAAAAVGDVARERELQVDLLVNNAGAGSYETFPGEDAARVTRMIHLNCITPVELTARFLPAMIDAGGGAVVSIASTAALQPVPSMAVYAATKAFLLSFTQSVWAETRGTGVRVVAVCPGPTDTGFLRAGGAGGVLTVRRHPDHVAAAALRALDARRSTVVSGTASRVWGIALRVVPRDLVARVTWSFLRRHLPPRAAADAPAAGSR